MVWSSRSRWTISRICYMAWNRQRQTGHMYRMDTAGKTQGQSVGQGEKARRKLSSTGGRALGYRLSPNHFQTVKRLGTKMLCIIVPNGEQFLQSSFREFLHDGYYLATVARFFHQAFLTRNERTTGESKTFRMLPVGAIQFALRKFCFWRITTYRK